MERRDKFAWDHDPLVYHECGLTGYTGVDPDTIVQMSILSAKRTQIGPRGLYKGSLAQLSNGDLITAVCEFKLNSWPIRIFRSSDQGDTWQKIVHTPLFGKEPGLTCLENGSLLLTLEDRFVGTVAHSVDGGRTWRITEMKSLLPPLPETGILATVRNPIEHPDGTITLLRCWGHWEGSVNPPRSRVWLFHSEDGGRTWPKHEEIETWKDSFFLFSEADFLRLPDNRILATSRFEFDHPISGTKTPWTPKSVPNDHAAGHMVLLESPDEGKTWTPPRDFLSYGEVQGQLTLLKDGRIICTYTNYHLPFGTAAVVSRDLGKTWDTSHPFQLAISNATGTGWATTRQLQNGDLLTIYALEPYHLEPKERGTTVFQCVRWSLPTVIT